MNHRKTSWPQDFDTLGLHITGYESYNSNNHYCNNIY